MADDLNLTESIEDRFAAWPFEPFPAAALEFPLIDRFEAVAGRFPDRLAVSDVERSLSYGELSVRAGQVAGAIATAVDRPGPVAILLTNETRYPAAMLGVLAAGRAYLPLDAHHPTERNRQIAAHAGAVAVVTAAAFVERARAIFAGVPVLDLDAPAPAEGPSRSRKPGPDDLAYITYTSGSTGRPKGVYQSHRGLLHDILQSTNTLRLSADDRTSTFHSPSLVQGTRIAFGALLNGGSVHMLRPAELGPAGIAAEIRTRRITIFRSVATLFTSAAETLGAGERFDALRLVYLGGDRVTWSDFDVFRRVCRPEAAFGVHLGATECSTVYLQWLVDEKVRRSSSLLPIGRTLDDRRVDLVDGDGSSVGAGEIGEFAVTGRYNALGYWHDPELTAQAFIADPKDPAVRTYRTGDLGRRRSDGLYEFVGRKDAQLKLHGHRIEPGEVEAALRAAAPLRDAAVVVRKNAEGVPRALIAYVELRPGIKGLLPRHVLAMAAQCLPPAMVPAAVVIVDALPRLASLKLDRARLAAIDAERAAKPSDESLPLLRPITEVFERVLGVAGATADDNLRTLGGNSLQAVEVALELERRLGAALPVGTFRASQSIRALAIWLERQIDRPLPADAAFYERAQGDHLEDRLGEFHARQDIGDVGPLVAGLAASFADGRSLASDRVDLAKWANALDLLFLGGRLDVLEYAAPQLAKAHPEFEYAATICAFLGRMPPLDESLLPFTDKRLQAVQVVERPGADTVILLFCDRFHTLGMPLAAIHRWIGRLSASLIYLRDFRRQYFLGGVRDLGPDRAGTIAALRALIGRLGGRRVLAYGNSAGSFAALDYGAALDAEAVLAVAGPTNVTPEFNGHLRWARSAARIRETMPTASVDLRQAYAGNAQPSRVRIVFGEHEWDDRLQAENLAGLPNVELRPVANYIGHNASMELVRRDEFGALLDWFVAI